MTTNEEMQSREGLPPVTIGVMAYNEERNIGEFLDSLLVQTAGSRIASIVVVASGCTDRTADIVREFRERDPRIFLIEEPERSGKISAINRFLFDAKEEIVFIASADIILEPQTIEFMLVPLDDPEVGMVGAHPIPVNSRATFFGYAAHLMWTLHHEVASRDPKMGELIAFRNVFRRLNPNNINDELSVHQLVRSAGYKLAYAGNAHVYNKGPETLKEFISQRVRCIVGNLQIMREHNVPAPTMRTLPVLRAAAPHILGNWRRLHWTIATAGLELYCRTKSHLTYRSQKRRARYKTWDQITTSKSLQKERPRVAR